MTNTLFNLNIDGELEVNKPEARKIKEYANLFIRDKGSQGDYDGRKKLVACAEIYYIYLVYDVRSIYYNLDKDEKALLAKKDAGLKEDWKEDNTVKEAIKRYKEDFKLTSGGIAYVVAERGYYSTVKDVEYMQDSLIEIKKLLKSKVKALNLDNPNVQAKLGDLETNTMINEINILINSMSKTQKEIMNNISNFPNLAKDVKTLAIKFAEEEGGMKTVVGGRTLGNREE